MSIKIFFLLAQPIILNQLKDQEILEGNNIILSTLCLECSPTTQFEWHFYDQKINSSDRHIINLIDSKYSLTILKSDYNDKGLYKFSIFNDLGLSETSCNIIIISNYYIINF